MKRLTAILAGSATLALLGATFLVTMGRNSAESCFTSTAAGADIGGPFTLVNGAGETVTEADVITEPALIYFGYSFCPDVCPIDNARNATYVLQRLNEIKDDIASELGAATEKNARFMC